MYTHKFNPLEIKNINFIIPKREQRKLHIRAYFAQQWGHKEICGVIAVDKKRRLKFYFSKNRSRNPYRYLLYETDIVRIYRTITISNRLMLGSFHSHPISEAYPSVNDIKHGFLNGFELIYDVCGREARLWLKDKRGEVVEAIFM